MLYPGIACNAAKGGNMDVLEMLKTLHVDLQIPDINGNTPLHLAARYNQWIAAKYLLDHDVDSNMVNEEGRTPLDEAIIQGNEFIAKSLI